MHLNFECSSIEEFKYVFPCSETDGDFFSAF